MKNLSILEKVIVTTKTDACCPIVWFEANRWGKIDPLTIIKATNSKVQLENRRWRYIDSEDSRIRQTFAEAKSAMISLLLIERDQIIDRLRRQNERIERFRELSQQ